MWHKVRRSLKRYVEGQSLVEMAFALPVLLIMLLGMVELGLLLRAHLVVVNANREATRYAARGTHTDEDIAIRAFVSFAGQLPAQLDGDDANVKIIVSRFYVPADGDPDDVYAWPQYITGTLGAEIEEAGGADSQVDLETYLEELRLETIKFNEDLLDSEPDATPTSQDVVLVEIFHRHAEVLHAPIVDLFFPDQMIVYSKTVMRVSRSRVY
jgi:hypothetical protein